jgi:hypothetical protein
LAGKWTEQSVNWLESPFVQLRAETLNTTIIQSMRLITKLKRTLTDQPILIERVLTPLTAQIDQFKKRLPLLTRLRHPGIKTKHWELISDVVGFTVQPSLELNLQEFLDLNLERWKEPLTEIAAVAAQEYNIESALDQLDAELQQLKFSSAPFRRSGHFILTEIDQVISTIDDQIVTTQTLLTSPYIGPVKKRALDKLDFLRENHHCLDQWILCQRSWLYLQPIFTGTSIQQKLYKEAREWTMVDQIWGSVMKMTHDHPEFMTVMHNSKLESNLNTANELLASITRGLNLYLEAKRLGFPRFFFLSNDELISFLSNTKDFTKVQDSMQKLFEYVQSITVTDELLITHMNDSQGESVLLCGAVDGDTAEIEDWLNGFEDEMRVTLKDYTRDALADLSKKKKDV